MLAEILSLVCFFFFNFGTPPYYLRPVKVPQYTTKWPKKCSFVPKLTIRYGDNMSKIKSGPHTLTSAIFFNPPGQCSIAPAAINEKMKYSSFGTFDSVNGHKIFTVYGVMKEIRFWHLWNASMERFLYFNCTTNI